MAACTTDVAGVVTCVVPPSTEPVKVPTAVIAPSTFLKRVMSNVPVTGSPVVVVPAAGVLTLPVCFFASAEGAATATTAESATASSAMTRLDLSFI